ncbi:MAG: hypothetical protein ABIP19_14540 [Dermatophilaceae bacterium]
MMILNAVDRCDRCGAQAYVLLGVHVPECGDRELLFCAHHYRQHERQLAYSGARVLHDERPLVQPLAR